MSPFQLTLALFSFNSTDSLAFNQLSGAVGEATTSGGE